MVLYDPTGVRVKMQDISQIRVKLTGKLLAGIKFTTPPTTTEYFVGDTMDWTGAVVSLVNEMGTAIEDVTSQCTFSPVSGYEFTASDISNYKQITATCTIDGVIYTATMTCKVEAIPTLETRTWSQISDDIKTGKISRYASAGDTKTFTYAGNTYTARLVSINDGTGDAAQWYPNYTADFVADEVYPQLTAWGRSAPVNWRDCTLRSICGTIYEGLPSDLKDVIINKNHLYREAKDSTNTIEVADKVWSPTLYELNGSNLTVTSENNTNNKRLAKLQAVHTYNGSATNYWFATINNCERPMYRTAAGQNTYTNISSGAYVAFGFRLGQA